MSSTLNMIYQQYWKELDIECVRNSIRIFILVNMFCSSVITNSRDESLNVTLALDWT